MSTTRYLVRFDVLDNPDVLYPYYERGFFPGIPEGLSPLGFHDLIKSAMSFMKFETAHLNGEMVAVFERRPRPYNNTFAYEAHTIWFTETKRKRAITLQEYVKTHDRLVTFVPAHESGGHFAMVRMGMGRFIGEYEDMHVFEAF